MARCGPSARYLPLLVSRESSSSWAWYWGFSEWSPNNCPFRGSDPTRSYGSALPHLPSIDSPAWLILTTHHNNHPQESIDSLSTSCVATDPDSLSPAIEHCSRRASRCLLCADMALCRLLQWDQPRSPLFLRVLPRHRLPGTIGPKRKSRRSMILP